MTRRGVELPPGASMRDAWEALGAIDGGGGQLQDGPRDAGPTRRRSERTPCPCQCGCGAYGSDGSRCFLCGQGVHHRCGRACRPFEPEMTEWHGIKALTNYVPARQACDGGRGGSGGAGPRARRH